jgi:hypothetical protein
MAVYHGDLIAAGSIYQSFNTPIRRIARWTGTAWEELAGGVNGNSNNNVQALAVFDDELIVAGEFTSAGGRAANNIARWNGSSWQTLQGGVNYLASSLAVVQGELVAGGSFRTAGTTIALHAAVWNRKEWRKLGDGFEGEITTLIEYNGELIAAGDFSIAGHSLQNIARWNGSTWQSLGSGVNGNVYALAVYHGELIAGGDFMLAGGNPVSYIARWNGNDWLSLDSPLDGSVDALSEYNNELIVGGNFGKFGGAKASGIARWDGSTWRPFNGYLDANIRSMVVYNGDLVVGGRIYTGQEYYVARWDGDLWHPLGQGLARSSPSPTPYVFSLTTYNGELIAAGLFDRADGMPVSNIAGWDGSQWRGLGSGLNYEVSVLTVYRDTLIAGGSFTLAGGVAASGIARWNGTGWAPLGSGITRPGTYVEVSTLGQFHGELNVTGSFQIAGGLVSPTWARWSDTPVPWVSVQPQPQVTGIGSTLTLEGIPATGLQSVSFRWLRNGVPVANGPGGASPGGGVVSSAAGKLNSPTNGRAAVLSIDNVQRSDAGEYSIEFINDCGAATSIDATVDVFGPPCPADFDHNGYVNSQDFFDFVVAFLDLSPTADFNQDTFINTQDFFDFLTAFFASC